MDALLGVAVGTILVSKEPFSASDGAEIQRVAREMKFEGVLAPEPAQSDPVFAAIAETDDPGSVRIGFPADISPPTDNRPFFFQMIRYQDVLNPSIYRHGLEYLTRPVLVLFSLTVAVVGLTFLCILVPVLVTTSRKALQGMFPMVVFFSGIGLGYILLEISQMQRLNIFLGHPTYGLAVVLFSLLISSGIGSFASERLVSPGLR